jgi:hypothetical protein
MSEDELANYFTKAKADKERGPGGYNANYRWKSIDFEASSTVNGNRYFAFGFYDKTQTVITLLQLKNTGKAHVVSITSTDYPLAKASL